MSSNKKLVSFENAQACVFCKKEDDDESLFGKFFHMKELSVHHNCMFFSSGLVQQAIKSKGILGFKIEDIQREVRRGQKLRCFFCKNNGATVGCAVTSCRRTFHFPCGKNNQSLHQFFGSFNSYCESHKPVQKSIKTTVDAFHCHICFSSLSKTDEEDRLYAACCKNNWYHKTCLQKYATSAGRYFFKCPMCKNSTDFINVMEVYGINIPEKDASWELEENAYHDLLYRPECGASICQCDEGRKYNEDGNWELLFCELCGSKARHRFCERLGIRAQSWECNECKVLEDQFEKKKSQSQVPSEISTQKNLNVQVSKESSIFDCDSFCSSFDFSSYPSIIPSITSLRRALRCVVQVTPIKMITDANGVTKPVLCRSNRNGKTKEVTPVKTTDTNRTTTLPLNINIEMGKSSYVTPTKTNKLELNKDNGNGKRKLDLDPLVNKRVRLQEKVINTFNNKQLEENSASRFKESSVKVKKERPVKVIKERPVKAKNSSSVKAKNSSSVKAKNSSSVKAKNSSSVLLQIVNALSMKNQSKKHSNCCSGNNCISKLFGFDCPNLKNNRL